MIKYPSRLKNQSYRQWALTRRKWRVANKERLVKENQ